MSNKVKTLMICAASTLAAAAHAGAKPILVCDGAKPVKLLVGFVAIEPGKPIGYGNAIMCWDKEVDTEEEYRRLATTGLPPKSGGQVTIVGITKLRK